MPSRPRLPLTRVPAADPEVREIDLEHPVLARVRVRVRRNRKARHVRLHVDEQGHVTASVPTRFAARRLDTIVRERAEWLHDVLVRMDLKARDTEVDLEAGDPVRLLGTWYPTGVERRGRRSSVRVEGERVVIVVPEDGDPWDALSTWYRRQARATFEQRVAVWADELALSPGKVSVRDQRTRWGSCTHRGDLSFNWRLVLAPLWVLDSIVVHELCHITYLDHSDNFWALLDRSYPRHAEASDWLRDHGPALRVTRPKAAGNTILRPTVEPATMSDLQGLALHGDHRRRRRGRPVPLGQSSLF